MIPVETSSGVSGAVRGLLIVGGTTGLLLVGATGCSASKQTENIKQLEWGAVCKCTVGMPPDWIAGTLHPPRTRIYGIPSIAFPGLWSVHVPRP